MAHSYPKGIDAKSAVFCQMKYGSLFLPVMFPVKLFSPSLALAQTHP
jgi:hypothetical protein